MKKISKVLKDFTLMDDLFFAVCMDQNKLAAQSILRAIFENQNLKVLDSHIQQGIFKTEKKSVRLDLLCKDENGNLFDVEVQNYSEKSTDKRAGFYSSQLHLYGGEKGMDYAELPDTYVIFIMNRDLYGLGSPKYYVRSKIYSNNNIDTGIILKDGRNIIFVNGEYRGDDPIGNLMRDFHETNPELVKDPVLKEAVTYYKDENLGGGIMNHIVDRFRKEMYDEIYAEATEKGLKDGWAKGLYEGKAQGIAEGRVEGKAQGIAEGRVEGKVQGIAEGRAEGKVQGMAEGRAEGKVQGMAEGRAEGKVQGIAEGRAEGKVQGIAEGRAEGRAEIYEEVQNEVWEINYQTARHLLSEEKLPLEYALKLAMSEKHKELLIKEFK